MKRRYIKDSIWGDIEIMHWEYPLFSTIPLNRLHFITQNASAFRVYPALKHSRFVHSIGVMHVSGLVFSNLVRNLALKFDSSGNLEVPAQGSEEVIALTDFDDETRRLEKITTINNRHAEVTDEIEIPLLAKSLGFGLGIHPPRRYLLTHAAVRLAGLVHDIGHLPYSHTSERAISKFLDMPVAKKTHPIIPRILEQIKKRHPEHIDRTWNLHELLGELIVTQMISKRDKLHLGDLTTLLLKYATEIVFGKRFPILKSIISGIVDADRIDYVRRDCETSGFLTSSVDYSRLFHSMNLLRISKEEPSLLQADFVAPAKPTKKVNRTIVAPSPRAASDVEKLLRERFLAYRHVYSHHKVLLFDEVVQRSVIHLAKKKQMGWLFETIGLLMESDSASKQSKQTPGIFDRDDIAKVFIDLETKMDDGWLEGKMKDQWLGYLQHRDGGSTIESKWLRRMVFKLAVDKSQFHSGYKNPSDFWNDFRGILEFPESPQVRRGQRVRLDQAAVVECIPRIELGLLKDHDVLCLIADQTDPPTLGADYDFLDKMGLQESCRHLLEQSARSPLFNFWYQAEGGNTDSARGIIVERIKDELKIAKGLTKKAKKAGR